MDSKRISKLIEEHEMYKNALIRIKERFPVSERWSRELGLTGKLQEIKAIIDDLNLE